LSGGEAAAGAAGLPWPDGDPGGLRAAARQLGAGASALRSHAGTLGFTAAGLSDWRGLGSGGFQQAVTTERSTMARGAAALERAAGALGKLAVTIDDAQDEVVKLAERVKEAEEAAQEAESRAALTSIVAAGAGEAVELFGADPPAALRNAAEDASDAAGRANDGASSARGHADEVRRRAIAHAEELCQECKRADSGASGVVSDVAGAAPRGGSAGGPPAAGARYAAGVATRMGVSDFKELAFYRAGITPGDWNPGEGLDANDGSVRAVYAYYRQLGLENPEFQWMKMAAVGGPLFYAGFRDIDNAGDWADKAGYLKLPGLGDLSELPGDELKWYESQFLTMQKAIFSDLAWQHEAFALGGAAAVAGAVSRLPATERHQYRETLRSWDGIGSGDPNRIADGNFGLIEREQGPVIQKYYDEMSGRATGGLVTGQLTDRADTPIEGSQTYSEYSGEGNIANYDDRIDWIRGSLWPAHLQQLESPGAVEGVLARDFDAEADRYRQFDPGSVPGDLKDGAEEAAKDLVEKMAPRGPNPIFYP